MYQFQAENSLEPYKFLALGLNLIIERRRNLYKSRRIKRWLKLKDMNFLMICITIKNICGPELNIKR
jgi:hypothetical protein